MPTKRPLILVHGYSDSSKGFAAWKRLLVGDDEAAPARDVRVAEYVSLTNEISIKDIAEGFDRALRLQAGLGADEEFDAIVHSTGMLVVRSWLTTYPARKDRLKHLIALAPATWGSPLAHKGRSWLGSIIKGSKDPFAPDFLEAGNGVLDGLELGSRFTWELAHRDLFGDEVYYGPTKSTPYVFVFCGARDYAGLRALANEPGTDGTVRLAGTSLNCRKAIVDLTLRPDHAERVRFTEWRGASEIPVVLMNGLNHHTIMHSPSDALVELVHDALAVESAPQLKAWVDRAKSASVERSYGKKWQQFVVRLVDERGDPVPDYNIRLFERGQELRVFTADVHTYDRDESLRNFHVDVTHLVGKTFVDLQMKIVASSGTELLGYVGYSTLGVTGPEPTIEVEMDLTALANGETTLFYPFTTTLIEIKLNREPMPLAGESRLCKIA